MKTYFSYELDEGFLLHTTPEEAKKYAEKSIERYRDYASDGWPDEVYSVCWGEVRQKSKECDITAIEGGEAYACNFRLEDIDGK